MNIYFAVNTTMLLTGLFITKSLRYTTYLSVTLLHVTKHDEKSKIIFNFNASNYMKSLNAYKYKISMTYE